MTTPHKTMITERKITANVLRLAYEQGSEAVFSYQIGSRSGLHIAFPRQISFENAVYDQKPGHLVRFRQPKKTGLPSAAKGLRPFNFHADSLANLSPNISSISYYLPAELRHEGYQLAEQIKAFAEKVRQTVA